jgi:hypothetical protein
MPYMIDHATAVAEQLERFTTGYAHHVVGQHANLEFWLGEARNALDTLNDYGKRFNKMASAQKNWVDAHDTTVGSSFCSHCGGPCELQTKMAKPLPPQRYASGEREAAAQKLKDAAYHFLRRCYRMNLLDEAELRSACKHLDTSVDLADLNHDGVP